MKSPDQIKKAVEALGICHDLMVFNPSTGEDIDPFFLNEDDRALYDGIENILQYIQQLEAQVHKWIPVTERLPEDYHDVLVALGETVDVGFYHHRYGWECYSCKRRNDVTHWMPLPSAPEHLPDAPEEVSE